jgi:hypothetical protein
MNFDPLSLTVYHPIYNFLSKDMTEWLKKAY